MRLLILIFTLLLYASPSLAEVYRVAAWNIADLHHEEDHELRPNIGTKRKSNDYSLLRLYAERMGRDKKPADIISLQEIGTKMGAEKVFPPDKYRVFMSKRYARDTAARPSKDIYTAIAIRRDRNISVIKQEDLEDLSIYHPSDPPEKVTRSGTALLLDVSGQDLWVVSVHLKSSCSNTRSADTSTNENCETFWRQHAPLASWIEDRQSDGVPFIIAGDFNRRFRQFNGKGPFWRAINGGDLIDPLLVKHPEAVTRKCPTRLGKSTQPIDWITIDAEIADTFVEGSFWETRFSRQDVEDTGGKKSKRLSDHCPISIDLVF